MSLASLYNGQLICVCDIPRKWKFTNYDGIEELKNGMMIQEKYHVRNLFVNVDLEKAMLFVID